MVLIVSISDLGGSRRIGITSIAIHTANSNRRQFWRVFGTPSTDAAMIFARANFVYMHLSSVTDVSDRSVFTNSYAELCSFARKNPETVENDRELCAVNSRN